MAERKFFIQWDSTNDCNLRCAHCYHGREGEEHEDHCQELSTLMSLPEVKLMIDDLHQTTARWGFIPRLQISGGEPFMREDLLQILDYTQALNIETRILTNGTLITRERAKDIKQRGVKRLQISIDGSRKTHNTIRNKPWSYDFALDGIRNCADVEIDVTVSMTAMKSNKHEFEDVIKAAIEQGAKYVGFQSYVPDKTLGLNDPEFVGAEE